jgi:hypothetical protein
MPRSPSMFAVVTLIAFLFAPDVDHATAEGGIKERVAPGLGLEPALAVVSEDPYTNPGTYHRSQVEPDSFAFGSTVVSVFQSGRSYRCGASNIGWSVSRDAGTTWTDGFLPSTTHHSTPHGQWKRATDPVVAYDAAHDTWLAQVLGIPSCPFAGGDVIVSASTDNGATFGGPVIIKRQRRTQGFDKNWIGCDNFPESPFYGTCYAAWDDYRRYGFLYGEGTWHPLIHAYRSTDGGLTWSKAALPEDPCGVVNQIVVQPSGKAIIQSNDCSPWHQVFVSKDGGRTYRGPFRISTGRVRGAAGMLRSPYFMSSDVDASGRIYTVWRDCRFRSFEGRDCTHNDLVMSTSDDGRHWSDIVRIPIDPRSSSVDHFLPALAVDPQTSGPTAHVAIVYYFYPQQRCDETTCDLSVGFTSSVDGGSTWSVQQLAGPFKNTWFPLTTSGYMVGDYMGISFVDGRAIPVFIVGSEGDCELGDVTSCNVWTASATISLAS